MEIVIDRSESIELCGQELELLPQKAIYWKDRNTLLLADLHLGKSTHFRKHGIAVPNASKNKNWLLLHQLFRIESLREVIFLGDLFHSDYNKDWEVFGELLELYPNLKFHLVNGNHDILDERHYSKLGIEMHAENLQLDPFILTHEPLDEEPDNELYNLAGHIHPGVRLRGKGRQSHRSACFYFGMSGGILPAFGSFTGLHTLDVKEGDRVFVIVENKVIPVA
ncbi:MAG: metallophosphoesterase [Flavobacteriales bacterium]|nr:metallophosphoesterase [Flavobacteriales bacterium]